MDLKLKFNFESLKENKQLIFIIVVVLIAAFLGKKIWDVQDAQLKRANDKIKNYEKILSLAGDVGVLSKEFDSFRGIGWLTNESVEIMGAINDLVNKHGLEILSFDPSGLEKKENYSVFSMRLSLRADYFSFARFLVEIEELKTLTKVVSLKINPEGNTSQEEGLLVKVNLSIKAFIIKN